MSLIFSNLVVSNIKFYNQNMCNMYAKYVKILEICKLFDVRHQLLAAIFLSTKIWNF